MFQFGFTFKTNGQLSIEPLGILKKLGFSFIEMHLEMSPGGRLNKKDGLTRYGDSHVKDKTS